MSCNVLENEKVFQNTNLINICYSSDKNYAKYLALSIASILTSKSPKDKFCFYILDGGILEADKQKILNLKNIADFEIKFIKVDNKNFENCPLENTTQLTLASYYRLLIPDFIPEVDKIIYLDCDIQIKSSLKDLFSIDINDYYFAAVEDIAGEVNAKRLKLEKYFNSGVLLLNLNKFREINFTSKVFPWIDEHRDILRFHDQDVLNIYFADKIKFIDKKWNMQGNLLSKSFKQNIKDANVVHYVSSEKRDFVFMALPIAMKTDYKIEFSRLYIGRICKFITQWFFRIRNKDEYQKQITILGFDFYIDRKNK